MIGFLVMKAKYWYIEDLTLRKSMTNRDRQMRCRYGITLEDFNRMYDEQNGCCKLCDKKKRLVVEHNHDNGKVRGLTCDRCNLILSMLEPATHDFIDKIRDYLISDGEILDFWNEDPLKIKEFADATS